MNFRLMIASSRPISWVNTAYPFAATYLVITERVDVFLIIMSFFFLIPYNYLMYGINDVFDYESDMLNPRKSSIEGAIVPKKLHKPIIVSSAALTVPFVLYGLVAALSLESRLVLILSVFMVLAYSVPPLRFKERPFLDSFTSACHFSLPLLYALSVTEFSVPAVGVLVALFLWSMASHAFGAVQDIIPDRRAGIGSIGTKFGARFTARFAAALYVSACIALFASGVYPLLSLLPLVYFINIKDYFHLKDSKSSQANVAWRRFIFLNLFVGFIVTMSLILSIL